MSESYQYKDELTYYCVIIGIFGSLIETLEMLYWIVTSDVIAILPSDLISTTILNLIDLIGHIGLAMGLIGLANLLISKRLRIFLMGCILIVTISEIPNIGQIIGPLNWDLGILRTIILVAPYLVLYFCHWKKSIYSKLAGILRLIRLPIEITLIWLAVFGPMNMPYPDYSIIATVLDATASTLILIEYFVITIWLLSVFKIMNPSRQNPH